MGDGRRLGGAPAGYREGPVGEGACHTAGRSSWKELAYPHLAAFSQDGSKVRWQNPSVSTFAKMPHGCGCLHPASGTAAKIVASHVVLLGMEKT